MPVYNLIEYSDNYSDTSGSLWQLKRDEIEKNNDLTVYNLSHSNTNQILLAILAKLEQKTMLKSSYHQNI